MTAAPTRILSGPELRALSARSDAKGAARFLAHAAVLAGTGWLVAQAGPVTVWPAMLLLGIAQVALFAVVHETIHLTAFASRRANRVAGWLAACPSLLNWHFYTAFHLAHHRHTQDPARDPELLSPTPTTWPGYVFRVLAIPFWRLRARVVRDCWRGDLSQYPYILPAAAPQIIRSVRAMTVAVGGAAILSAAVWGPWTPLAFWIVPQLLAQPLLRAYLLTEHTLCPHEPNGLVNTRTTLTNAALRFLMWNMPFHAEHHMYPSIPFHRLPAAHAALRGRLQVVQRGYARWQLGFMRTLRRT